MNKETVKKTSIIFTLLLTGIILLLSNPLLSYAAVPPGTIIRNQAVISFETLAGETFETSSNEVIIIVQPVYGISILPDETHHNAAANMEIVFPYTLTFTGNVKDDAWVVPTFDHVNSTFLPKTHTGGTGISIYNDLNGNGGVDPSDRLVSMWIDTDTDGTLDSSEITSLGLGRLYNPDDIVNLLVSFSVSPGILVGNETHFGIDGTSVGDNIVTDIGNTGHVTIVDDAVIIIKKSSNPVNWVDGNAPVTYTFFAENEGTQPANIRAYSVDGIDYKGVLLYDILPKDRNGNSLPPLAIPPPSSVSPAQGTIIYSNSDPTDDDPTTWNWSLVAQQDVKVIGYITSDGVTHNPLQQNESMGLSFTITAPSDMEQVIENTGFINYQDNAVQPVSHTVPSNIVYIRVNIVPQIAVDIRDTDYLSQRPPNTPLDDGNGITNDTQRMTANAGTRVYFTNRIENRGNINDTFNITLSSVSVNWTAVLLKTDGISPLIDTGSDSLPDTGILPPGETYDVVIRITIPADQTDTNVSADLLVTASSQTNNSITDATRDIIDRVKGGSMNLANTNADKKVIEEGIQKEGLAGGFVFFPLIVENKSSAGAGYDTYTLSTTLPDGWNVLYYIDLNENAIIDDSEMTPTLTTTPVPPEGKVMLIAMVRIPDAAGFDADSGTGGQQPYLINFTATSSNNGASNSITDEVMVMPIDTFELRPDRNGGIVPGGTVVYTHELQNYGSRFNRFYLDITPGHEDWVYLLYLPDMSQELSKDKDTNRYYIDLNAAVDANNTIKTFLIKMFATQDTPPGTMDVTIITATARNHDITDSSSVVDVTNVYDGNLYLEKSMSPPGQVRPGDIITYTTTFSNLGAKDALELIIYDAIPDFTMYILRSISAVYSITGLTGATFEKSVDGGIAWIEDDNGSGPDSSVTNIRIRFNGALGPGENGRISFQVQVK